MNLVRLGDYRPSAQLLHRTDLCFRLFDDHAVVEAELHFAPNPAVEDGRSPLRLKGVNLQLEELRLDGKPLDSSAYGLDDEGLTLRQVPAGPFRLASRVRIHPQTNTSLEGLYLSEGLFTTQCEAEGFRRITFHPDRPDLLSRFRVRIEADRQRCPVLLSNGNCVDQGNLPPQPEDPAAPARHFAVWDDPYPKPSYLFALVAGRLEEVNDHFTTASGRRVLLRLHVEPGDMPYTAHALACLKRAMDWDEQVYGLEYDLDEYNVVAVRHFNMGAMENKSLNIFNSKLVLADSVTATDVELERIESVIAHEYFHNWTGNRITCRDWFQLSLKEGLTVFRDQCFSADQHGDAVSRIEQASHLRNSQFREDAGPTAHPIQPDAYRAIDNFYTTTIYEKGAEVIRSLHTLIGEETFLRGMALYVERHDGSAATCDDFLQAMEDAAGSADADAGGTCRLPPFAFSAFRRWYHQAGTPVLRIRRRWNRENGTLELTVRQHTSATPGQPHKDPVVIPLAIGLIGQAGQPLPIRLRADRPDHAAAPLLADGRWGKGTRLLVIDQPEQHYLVEGLPSQAPPPGLSLLRRFSAPVRVEMGRPTSELVHLLASDLDTFARWDAGQTLLRRVALRRAAGRPDPVLEEELITAYERILADPSLSETSRAVLLSLPGLPELEDAGAEPDPPALFTALQELRRRFGEALADPLRTALERCTPQWTLAWPEGAGARRLTARIWEWRVAAGDRAAIAASRAGVESDSMTLARAGLQALQAHPLPERQEAMQSFHDRWQDRPVILDSWFALEASAPFGDGLARVERLLAHPRFDPSAPNSVRAVLGGLAGNPPVFHAADGSGYRFMAERIVELDARNPITASRLAKVFSRWRSYGPERQGRMEQALQRLAAADLSANCREVVEQCLAG
jgi:aminopeptidase N